MGIKSKGDTFICITCQYFQTCSNESLGHGKYDICFDILVLPIGPLFWHIEALICTGTYAPNSKSADILENKRILSWVIFRLHNT